MSGRWVFPHVGGVNCLADPAVRPALALLTGSCLERQSCILMRDLQPSVATSSAAPWPATRTAEQNPPLSTLRCTISLPGDICASLHAVGRSSKNRRYMGNRSELGFIWASVGVSRLGTVTDQLPSKATNAPFCMWRWQIFAARHVLSPFHGLVKCVRTGKVLHLNM